ncbi:glutathione peroxidase [Sulfitobacter sp. F26204]|uniref:glutathione peroxidase n=1 Tax=Sulfitobacter sp. F26204 TaxID=2996014 RepID=UPI00225DEDDF|nr:glutathione peroxidase [Sulfitobacter sp. F26204]MCX7558363.1 glutathione peroxidase [Sulfitobacter sp. F26204]
MHWIFGLVLAVIGTNAAAVPRDMTFANIDGGTLNLGQWAGQPVLVVNTASQCGFTGQYAGLQALYDTFKGRGLVVLAVPSDDFNQELANGAEIKTFCEISFGLDLPMADITHVKGAKAHPFYKAIQKETGFVPRWNFNKVLIGPEGAVLGTWGATVKPQSRTILNVIEPLLK